MAEGDHYSSSTGSIPDENSGWDDLFQRQDLELKEFLEEFVQSEEFALRMLRQFEDKATETEEGFLQWESSESTAIQSIRPKRYHHASLIYEKLQKVLVKNNICNTVRNQIRAVEIIRQKIARAKFVYATTKSAREQKVRIERTGILSSLRFEYNISLPRLSIESKLVDKVLSIKNERKRDSERSERNRLQIVKKMVQDEKRRKEIEKAARKTYDYKVKRGGKVMKGLEVIGVAMELMPRVEEVVEEEQEPVEEVVEEVIVKDKKGKKDKKKSKKKSSKGSKKKDKKKKSKKSKSSKKSKKGEKLLELPIAPKLNRRDRITVEDMQDLPELMGEFKKLNDYIVDRQNYELEKAWENQVLYPEDGQLVFDPPKMIFKDFVNGHSYRKSLRFLNAGPRAKKILLDRIVWLIDTDDDLLLAIEPMGILKLSPGIKSEAIVQFNPQTLAKTAEAKIIFLTRGDRTERGFKQCHVNVVFVPSCVSILINPSVITFDEAPIWKAKTLRKQMKNFKTLKIKNDGLKECRVVITKVFTQLSVEQAWRNIISIMQLEEEEQKSIQSKEDSEELNEFPKTLLRECVENVFNKFRFERNIFNVKGKTEDEIKVYFRNIDYVGYHVEVYTLSVYERFPDGKLYCIGSQDVAVNAETTGHFLELQPDFLDFEVCVHDSIYQLSFDLYNSTQIPHRIRIRFPSTIKWYLSCKTCSIVVQAGSKQRLFIKFSPRLGIIEENEKFYDAENAILEFPIYICVETKGFEDTPPMRLDTFGAVTPPLGISLYPKTHSTVVDREFVLDLGVCSTVETVYAELEVRNCTLVPQEFAFLNLPPCLTVQPNFGFGHLNPMETKLVRLFFSPESNDIPKYSQGTESEIFIFKIVCESVKHMGGLKKKIDMKRVSLKLLELERIICADCRFENEPIFDDFLKLFVAVKTSMIGMESVKLVVDNDDDDSIVVLNHVPLSVSELANFTVPETVIGVVQYEALEEIGTEQSEFTVIEAEPELNYIIINARITVPRCDFSAQYVQFPETPCGSYSLMRIDLNAIKVKKLVYRAHFEIVGNNGQILVEPSCGNLEPGGSCQIYLIAKPEVPQSVIEDKARALRGEQLMEAKRAALLEKLEKLENEKPERKSKKGKKGKGKRKGKKDKKKKSEKETKSAAEKVLESLSQVTVDETEIIVGYFDYYPAEMCVWRNLEAYEIQAEFCCTISYCDEEKHENVTDRLYLKARCPVVRPSMIHDQNLQEIDFGMIAVGTSVQKLLKFQNIEREEITPKVDFSPIGAFSVPQMRDTVLPSEYFFDVPIAFTPTRESQEFEILEVTARTTLYPFILKGEGVEVVLKFTPNLSVCRLEAKKKSFTDFNIQVSNESRVPVTLNVVKMCELEGQIKVPKKPKAPKEKKKKGKSRSPSPKSKKSKKSGKSGKSAKNSETLTEDEEASIAAFECRNDGIFQVISECCVVPAEGKTSLKIRFGFAKEKKKKKGKGKKGKSTGTTAESSEKSTEDGKSQASSKVVLKKGQTYVAKFNVMLGGKTFLKDYILLGKFK